jgi:hypothetical protein
MQQSSFEQRVRRAEFGDYAAFTSFLVITIGVELVVLLLWSLVYLGNLSVFLTAVVLAGAAGACGGIIGFVLGIPKASAQQPTPDHPVGATGQAVQSRRYESSTALEEISEWLTKIVIGLGLVEFTTIAAKFEDLARRAAPLFSATRLDSESLVMFTEAILLTNILIGFSAAYVFTRMFLVSAFFRVDAANQELLARNVERVSEIGSAAIFDDNLSPDDRRSATDLLKVPISSLRTREDFVGWAKAHLIFHDYASANEALKRALDAAGWKDADLLGLYARTLAAQGNAVDARRYLGMALSLIGQSDPAHAANVIADQIEGVLASGQPGDLEEARKLLAQVPPSEHNAPRLLALKVAVWAQGAGQTDGDATQEGSEEATSARVEALNALRTLSQNNDQQSRTLMGRLRAGQQGHDRLFGVLRRVADDDKVTEALKLPE